MRYMWVHTSVKLCKCDILAISVVVMSRRDNESSGRLKTKM